MREAPQRGGAPAGVASAARLRQAETIAGCLAGAAEADPELRALRAALGLQLSIRQAAANGPHNGLSVGSALQCVAAAARDADELEHRIASRLADIWGAFYAAHLRQPHTAIVSSYLLGVTLALQAASAERQLFGPALSSLGLVRVAPGPLVQTRVLSAEAAQRALSAARDAGLELSDTCHGALQELTP